MQARLPELCGEFEEIFLASLWPQSMSCFGAGPSDDKDGELSLGLDFAAGLFPQVFAAAVERAGGIGLSGEFLRALQNRR